jgi:23S rRNA pseudouridine1911/1915/1917 synthase
VELQLLTGRTHQIRVHLSHLGHPIAGDCAYGGKSVSQRDLVLAKEAVGVGDHRAYVGGVHAEGTQVLSRQALHATKISFSHPMEKRQMNIIAPLYKVPLCLHAVLTSRDPETSFLQSKT